MNNKLTESISFLATPALRKEIQDVARRKKRREGEMIRLLIEFALSAIRDHPDLLADL